ncbi:MULTISPECIES: hypothetical protein [Vibrio]|uniref:Uncharacterized protein n=1 Tax=Vibrio nereis TaxID=693 RepID=A0A0M0HIF9_VIBNE|nr:MULTISPECIES: hypothetical protein [Vibrio]EIJ0985324.1 hypothetical protein [Vibrio vulnificus]EKF9857734.1 hypothetical protein [Vibrio cholerae]KOO01855.1 hypothetical protein AKJ17_18420 [Vibrio nereis]KQA30423.1 hypothetical protein XV72_17820 [Vibrio cholerae]PAR97620.1 hypothetical protein CGT79_17485 [Vibrio cholerae]
MSYRSKNRFRPVVDEVIAQKLESKEWKAESTVETAKKDAVKVLEAMLAEFGESKCLSALEKQGFNSASYEYIVKPLCEESSNRRKQYEDSLNLESTVC